MQEQIAEVDIVQIKILEVPEEKENSIKCIVDVRGVNGEPAMGKALLYFQKSSEANNIKYGDIISLRTNFSEIRPNGNPEEFDYSRYLKIHDIIHQGYVKNGNWRRITNDANRFRNWIFGIRQFLDDLLSNAGLSAKNLMVAKALILGAKESLDKQTLRTFSSAGAMHVLAVSGLHVGIVMLLFSFLLQPLKRLPKGRWLFMIVVILLIWFYALVTGMSSSVMRASVMFSFVIIGKEIERESSVYQSIMVSAFFLVLMEPLVIFQVGFQLSYLAVLGIVFLQPKIYNLFYVKFPLIDKIWQISSVSIAAQIATFPLGLFYFHQFPNFFMVSNLIVIPLAFAILFVGLAYFALFWIPYVELAIATLLDFLLSIMNVGVKGVEQLPYSIYWGVSIYWFEVFWIYLIILGFTFAFILRNTKFLLTSMVLTAIFIGFNISEKIKFENTNELVIYNVTDANAIDVFHGRENIFIANQSLLGDQNKLLFHVMHHWFYRAGKEQATAVIPFEKQPNVIEVGEKYLLLLEGGQGDTLPKTDMVYLYNCDYINNQIVADFEFRKVQIVIGNGVGYNVKNYLKKRIPDLIYDLKTEGAFTLQF